MCETVLVSPLSHLSDPFNSVTSTRYGFHPQFLTQGIGFETLSCFLRSFNVMPTLTFYRQSKAKMDGLLVTHYYKKTCKRFKAFADSTQYTFWGISHMLIKRAQMPFSTASPFVWHYSV